MGQDGQASTMPWLSPWAEQLDDTKTTLAAVVTSITQHIRNRPLFPIPLSSPPPRVSPHAHLLSLSSSPMFLLSYPCPCTRLVLRSSSHPSPPQPLLGRSNMQERRCT
eukprot:5309990-Pyramimonas_sp.AAC.1